MRFCNAMKILSCAWDFFEAIKLQITECLGFRRLLNYYFFIKGLKPIYARYCTHTHGHAHTRCFTSVNNPLINQKAVHWDQSQQFGLVFRGSLEGARGRVRPLPRASTIDRSIELAFTVFTVFWITLVLIPSDVSIWNPGMHIAYKFFIPFCRWKSVLVKSFKSGFQNTGLA